MRARCVWARSFPAPFNLWRKGQLSPPPFVPGAHVLNLLPLRTAGPRVDFAPYRLAGISLLPNLDYFPRSGSFTFFPKVHFQRSRNRYVRNLL